MNNNVTHALVNVLAKIESSGSYVTTRGNHQKEILSELIKIKLPHERVIVTPNRNNNIFALIAETLWVLAGKDDMNFLTHYLPRAGDFSDDGKIWRAAYGPRLRNWYGTDQFKETVRILKEDTATKRAVMIIFDPQKDYVETKDVPCNNWLHFMARDGKLNLSVTVRANDAIWGFGGINSFEWSTLHEMMANWTGLEIGTLSWYTGTIHVYERHYTTAKKIIANFNGKTMYDFGITSPSFTTNFDFFDSSLENCFDIENELRAENFGKVKCQILKIEDEFLKYSMLMLYVYNMFLAEQPIEKIVEIIQEFETNDFKIAAIEYISRRLKKYDLFQLNGEEKKFFDYYWSKEGKHDGKQEKLSVLSSI